MITCVCDVYDYYSLQKTYEHAAKLKNLIR